MYFLCKCLDIVEGFALFDQRAKKCHMTGQQKVVHNSAISKKKKKIMWFYFSNWFTDKNGKVWCAFISSPQLSQHLLKLLIIAASLQKSVLKKFGNSSSNSSRAGWLDKKHLLAFFLNLIKLKLWLGHCQTLTWFDLQHSTVDLWSLLCWKGNLLPFRLPFFYRLRPASTARYCQHWVSQQGIRGLRQTVKASSFDFFFSALTLPETPP